MKRRYITLLSLLTVIGIFLLVQAALPHLNPADTQNTGPTGDTTGMTTEETTEATTEATTEESTEETTVETTLPQIEMAPPYYIKVNVEANTVTIYCKDRDGNYTQPYMAMVCSTGTKTPQSGVFKKGWKWEWLGLFGGVYGQYATQIGDGNILFHSVPYTVKGDPSTLKEGEFDKLGTAASLGCIRLQVRDAKWIFDNYKNIYRIEFYNDPDPGPLGKPTAPKIGWNTECLGWDPTDPDPNNPWKNIDLNQ